MSETQELHSIDLVYKSKPLSAATRNGNNAAWMCWCGSREALLGAGHGGKHKPVECRSCGSRYEVRFEESTTPVKVVEV